MLRYDSYVDTYGWAHADYHTVTFTVIGAGAGGGRKLAFDAANQLLDYPIA